jgi:aryl-alcohol dehydrogenase-like predicted oxidoreductase
MEHRKIGSLSVSVVGLGCNNFGMRVDESRTHEIVHAALDHGINFFDTADIYGGTKSEEFLGRALKGKRDQAVIATKFGAEVDADRKGARPEYVKQACADSLQRLGIDTIDLYQLHTPDESVPIAETLGALDDLVREGKVREIGCSNFDVSQLRQARTDAKGVRFVSVQNEFSLFHRAGVKEVLDECAAQDMAFLPYFPLASGLLTGKFRRGQPRPEGTRLSQGPRAERTVTDENLEIVEKLIAFASRHGRTILELAFSWLLMHEPVSSVIAGATLPEQIRANASSPGWHLSNAEMDEVAQIVSGIEL